MCRRSRDTAISPSFIFTPCADNKTLFFIISLFGKNYFTLTNQNTVLGVIHLSDFRPYIVTMSRPLKYYRPTGFVSFFFSMKSSYYPLLILPIYLSLTHTRTFTRRAYRPTYTYVHIGYRFARARSSILSEDKLLLTVITHTPLFSRYGVITRRWNYWYIYTIYRL